MLFTGSILSLKREFFAQTGNVGFVLNCIVDNTSGTYHFGLSGDQGIADFMLQSGKIFYSGKFLHYYKTNEEFVVAAQFDTGTTSITKNNVPLAYGVPKPTGSFNYFYFSRENASLGAEFDLNVSGNNNPLYSIQNIGYLINSGQNAVTGYFSNLSTAPIRIFDSSEDSSQNYDFGKIKTTINPAASGAFSYSGDYNTIDISQPILTTFNTNFGDASVLFTIFDLRTFNRFVQLTQPTNFTFNDTGILNRDISYLNYENGFVTNDFTTSLVFQLKYVDGSGIISGGAIKTFTGIWDIFTGADSSTLVSMKTAGNFNSTMISGSGNFPANSSINFQLKHTSSGTTTDIATLVISGNDVINPITQTITRTNA